MRIGFEKRKEVFLRAGFLPAEANELAHTSREGSRAVYFVRMVRARRAIWLNAQRYRWSNYHYRQRVREDYEDKGILGKGERWTPSAIWELLRFFQEIFPVPDDYSSPWQKRLARKRGVKKRRKKVTRADMLKQRIADIDRRLPRVRSEVRKQKMLEQRAMYMSQLERLS